MKKQHLLNMIFKTSLKQTWCVRGKQYSENINQNLCQSQTPQLQSSLRISEVFVVLVIDPKVEHFPKNSLKDKMWKLRKV